MDFREAREIVQAHSLLWYWVVRELGVTMISLARRPDISVTTIGKSVIQREKLAQAKKYSLIDK
jgi:hypothetical protein